MYSRQQESITSVDWWDWQSGSRNRWCKAYKGFYYTVGKKGNRYGANVHERTSHLRIDWLIKNRHIDGHTLFFRCECGNCSSMTTPEECICCVEVPAVHSQMLSKDMQCITDSDIFISNFLNRHVLHVSMYEFLENVGPFDDNEPINEYVIIFPHFIQYVHFSVKCA
jgi:hypothetical protein